MNPEQKRLFEDKAGEKPWKKWGPYVSERQWGTVREDYSPNGTAWDYFPHDVARSRAYRWGEDGIAGITDHSQFLNVTVALWNGSDPILKERLFGLTNSEGNHGEDVKELYYYLDATPTHSYLKMLYKYPQRAFPYADLVHTNGRRSLHEPEYELLDTGVFDNDRYFDVFVEYARNDVEDWLMRITVHNRGPDESPIWIIPQAAFRNTWSWGREDRVPQIRALGDRTLVAHHDDLGTFEFYARGEAQALLTGNDTNPERAFGAKKQAGYFKDAFHRYLVDGESSAVNPAQTGTKAGLVHALRIPGGGQQTVSLRWVRGQNVTPFGDFDAVFERRRAEADEFYAEVQKGIDDAEARLIQRQAFAGMIWSKQVFCFDVEQWIDGDPGQPAPPRERIVGRNNEWRHLNNHDVISMPDKWEYPWYAAWDLAFHCIPLAMIDAEFAKSQLVLLTREWYMHPNGQLPAYEWAFSDVNPPVHAWAAWRVFQLDAEQTGSKDVAFLECVFHKLMLNFTWWVNRKDADGRNIFQGGFLGLDNIGVFDRSAPLPTGGYINQADGTSWMAMYSLNLMRIALELATHNFVYEDIATKFFEHFLHIAEAMTNMGGQGLGLWDDDDKFYYDVLQLPDGERVPLKVRSMVGLIPLFAVECLDSELIDRLPGFKQRLDWVLTNKPKLAQLVSRWNEPGAGEQHLLSLLRGHRMKRLLKRMLDPEEFLSDYGIRALSKVHERAPYVFRKNGFDEAVHYVPAESRTGLFGGNSNWRGPIWFPVNYLLVESLCRFHQYYGDDFKLEYPTGSGQMLTLKEIAVRVGDRLIDIFRADADGRRPALANHEKLMTDPHFKDYVLFHEYFHGDTGRGVGAAHQTGWTGLVAALIAGV